MKIEIGESLFYSWLRHVKEDIAQYNSQCEYWKNKNIEHGVLRDISNFQLLCSCCNQKKGAQTYIGMESRTMIGSFAETFLRFK
ncbi:MAG: hypothetical protein E7285_00835 [Lachnospiraceae bacterium]|nr:hypothetical protein [Lachnospiraceae bacterium]